MDNIAFFWTQYNYVLVRMYEPITFGASDMMSGCGTYRLHCLRQCLHAVDSFFKALFVLPAETFLYRSFAVGEQIQFVAVVASRLLLIEAEGWDLKLVKRSLDFLAIMNQIRNYIAEADEFRKQRIRSFAIRHGMTDLSALEEEIDAESETPGVFVRHHIKATSVRNWYKARLEGHEYPFPELKAATAPQTILPWPVPDPVMDPTMASPAGSSGKAQDENGWTTEIIGEVSWHFEGL
jgi:hypothetical protein